MEEKPKRRWFRFGLRTLLIAVTIFCVWLGWQVSIVRERQRLLQVIRDNDLANVAPYLPEYGAGKYWGYRSGCESCDVSAVRRMLGDETYMTIEFNRDPGDELVAEVADGFPETQITMWEEESGTFQRRQRGCFVDLIELERAEMSREEGWDYPDP